MFGFLRYHDENLVSFLPGWKHNISAQQANLRHGTEGGDEEEGDNHKWEEKGLKTFDEIKIYVLFSLQIKLGSLRSVSGFSDSITITQLDPDD